MREGVRNALRQGRSLNRSSPYALGFEAAIGAFYGAVRTGTPIDRRFSGESAVMVSGAIERVLALLPCEQPARRRPAKVGAPPDVLVIGGTGYIGRSLTAALTNAGRTVRVLSRGCASERAGRVEIVPGDLKNPADLAAALRGIRVVYHLAKAEATSWEGYLENDVAVAVAVAAAARAANVDRLIFAGTIACYDASQPDRPITEATPFGPMDRRNLYARSKALCEARLQDLAATEGLPLVIARPGIVVGADGPLQHWGIGRWHGPGAVRLWGGGSTPLPFVLVEDVAEGLARLADAPGVIGSSFNLVGDPLLSARDYLAAIHDLTGSRIEAKPGAPLRLYLADLAKYRLKRHVMRKSGLDAPSLIDWRARAHLSPFRNDHAKAVLGWRPEADRDRFVARAIRPEALFGF